VNRVRLLITLLVVLIASLVQTDVGIAAETSTVRHGYGVVATSTTSAANAVGGIASALDRLAVAGMGTAAAGRLFFAAEDLTAADLTGRTPEEIRQLAAQRGYEPHGLPDSEGNFRKFRDPVTKQQRLRIDQGHTDPVTGEPYNNPRAAVPHAHGYDPSGAPIRDPATGDKHFPFR
jgi:hypothetical protein